MFCKTVLKSLRAVAPVVIGVSLTSCVPLVIAGGAIMVGAVADEGFKYEPGLEGSNDAGNSNQAPADVGGADDYNMPAY